MFAAIGSAIIAFPAIADKAETRRESAFWQERAQSYVSTADAIVIEGQGVTSAINMENIAPITKLKQAKHVVREHRCLSEAIYYEARSETRAGQKAVAEVVINRAKSRHYPDTVCGVVYEGAARTTGCQFSFTCDGATAKTPHGKHWNRAQEVARLSLTSGYTPFMGRATHYHTLDVNPPWSSDLHMIGQVGDHKFYRFRWKERNASATLMVAPPI